MSEFDIIDDMMQQAIKFSLETEVVWSFASYLESGLSIRDAAREALFEWDIA